MSSVAVLSLNVSTLPSVFVYAMPYVLLLALAPLAVPFCAFEQDDGGGMQVSKVLPRSRMEPFVLVSNRVLKEVVATTASARPEMRVAPASSTATSTIRAADVRRTPTSRG